MTLTRNDAPPKRLATNIHRRCSVSMHRKSATAPNVARNELYQVEKLETQATASSAAAAAISGEVMRETRYMDSRSQLLLSWQGAPETSRFAANLIHHNITANKVGEARPKVPIWD